MENKSFTCIVCPKSCVVNITVDGLDILDVKGNVCKRGNEYVRNEYLNPKRMITTTVKIKNGTYANLPVVSKGEIEKAKLFDALSYLYQIEVEAPVKEGDVLVEGLLGSDVDILAARDMKKQEEISVGK